jgi:hypothetical protein
LSYSILSIGDIVADLVFAIKSLPIDHEQHQQAHSAMAHVIAGRWRGASAFAPQGIATLRAANPELDFDEVAAGLAALAEDQR